jgi:3-deoxy-manno-octulosonate cytidylyltransferase (CMP-KDO synthetase)
MKILGVIPARYASTRFPGKPLALIHGISMIERVFGRASQATSLTEVVVATDDQRIYDHVISFGGKAVMTSEKHPSGTDRCAEVLEKHGSGWDAVINIQGDEPYIHPEQINQLGSCFENPECQIATLVKIISSEEELMNPNVPKVVLDNLGSALYFSRSPIPYVAKGSIKESVDSGVFHRHIGIYGYRPSTLNAISKLAPSPLEIIESLEQLRWLSNGYSIFTKTTDLDNHAVDMPADISKIEALFHQ